MVEGRHELVLTICSFRADDAELAELQARLHDPLIKWFSEKLKLAPLDVLRDGLVVQLKQQPEEVITTVQWLLFSLDDWTLAALDSVSHTARSLVVAFALW